PDLAGPTRSWLSAFLFLPSGPLGPHLCHPFHVHSGALALFLRRHRLQQVQRFSEIVLNGLLRGRKVQPPDLGELVVGAEHFQSRTHRLFRRSRERNSSKGKVFRTSSGCSHARRATMIPHLRTENASRE